MRAVRRGIYDPRHHRGSASAVMEILIEGTIAEYTCLIASLRRESGAQALKLNPHASEGRNSIRMKTTTVPIQLSASERV